MPRGPRYDAPGKIFHVMNRGIARRTMFERRSDFRYFLSRLAKAVRRSEIDVLAFVLMSTHFHLVLRSHGHLSEAMRRTQGEYVRHFNRSRRRDGALQRSRFVSKPVSSQVYLRNVVPYVDENPVQAGLVARPEDYRWSSAGARARGRHRRWLSADMAGLGSSTASLATRRARAAFIDARIRGRGRESQYESVVDAAPTNVAAWMLRKARLADGTAPGLPVAGTQTVCEVIDALGRGTDSRITVPGGRQHVRRDLLLAGLLRELCGVSLAHVARQLGTTDARAKRLFDYHWRCVADVEEYRLHAAEIVTRCLAPLRGPASRQTLV
jgi:REP element-mobilizing transposase RayT